MENKKVQLFSDECITQEEIIEAQLEWGAGIVAIESFTDGDYVQAAKDHIQNHMGRY